MASREMEELKVGMKMMMEKGFAVTFDGSMDPIQLRDTIQAAQERMPLEPGVTFIPEKFGDMDAELSVPEGARDDAVIVYIHGGGLICGNAASSRGYASMLAGETKIPVYAFSYRLAPEDKFPAAVDDCYEAYQAILKKSPEKSVFLIGESGGAYLSIVTAMRARDNGVKMPAGVIPYSPVIDMSGALNRVREGNKDFTVTPEGLDWLAGLYCCKEDARNPYVSPYYDDLHGMPPMLLAWDESETLAVDSEEVRDKLQKNGTWCHAKSYPDCFHAFATAGRGTPESLEILRDTVAFIHSRLGCHMRIVPYDPKYKTDFIEMNKAWISEMFVMEPEDERELEQIESCVEKGGQIFFALDGEENVMACCMIAPREDGDWEIMKFAARGMYTGTGAGSACLAACIDYARELHLPKIIIVSNRMCTHAVHLYRKFGFREIPVDKERFPFDRADIAFEMIL